MTVSVPSLDPRSALAAGLPVLVLGENGPVLLAAAEGANQQWTAWIARHGTGTTTALVSPARAEALGLAHGARVDAADITEPSEWASARAQTLRTLAHAQPNPTALRADGSVRVLVADEHDGLLRVLDDAGLIDAAQISPVMSTEGAPLDAPAARALAEAAGLVVLDRPALPVPAATPAPLVRFEVETTVPTTHGELRMRAYRETARGTDHIAIISGTPGPDALVRLHSECLTGEALGSLKCECGPQLDAALDRIAMDGGVVIYLRGHEGRGIGLVNKLRAYRLQEDGLDTLDANLALGLPADARDYGAAAEILRGLGITRARLLTNNPDKQQQLEAHGVPVSERVPLIVGVGAANHGYLEAKRDRMGHILGGEFDRPAS